MQKLKMHSPDITQANIAHIRTRFPHCVTEAHDANGNVVYKVDFDLLRQELADELVEGPQERYRLDWPGKRQAMLTANAPIAKSLRPCREESVNFDTTENLYIEGDNLEVLKLLQESYLGKVKMIYIDPPYNTGHDFIYKDNFAEHSADFLQRDGQFNDAGERMVLNLESNGRRHSDWLSMIYQRLRIAKNLLANDGVIFISIDDNEFENLKKICNGIYGIDNFIACIVWKRKRGRDNSARWFSKAHEYLLLYAKNKEYFNINYLKLDDETRQAYKNPDNDHRGVWRMLACWARGTQGGVSYDFTAKSGQYFSKRLWLFSKQNMTKLDEEDKLVIRGDNIYRKMFITENRGKIPETLWDGVSNAANAADEIKRIFNESIIFDTPKPIPYLIEMLRIATNHSDIILDFFSGSATTSHAVMQLNAEDGGRRKFIMIQWPEVCPPDGEAAKGGYKNICEIGKERIRRAGKKIKEEQPLTTQNLDVGFRVLKVQPSCMADVYYAPDEAKQSLLLYDNIKIDASSEDLLFQILTDWGVELHLPITAKTIKNKNVFFVDENSLAACFESGIDDEFVKELAGHKPIRVVFRDSGFANDDARINAEQIFKQLSPDTEVRVL